MPACLMNMSRPYPPDGTSVRESTALMPRPPFPRRDGHTRRRRLRLKEMAGQ